MAVNAEITAQIGAGATGTCRQGQGFSEAGLCDGAVEKDTPW